jgi:hypothetical protein
LNDPDQAIAWHQRQQQRCHLLLPCLQTASMASTQEQQWHDAELRNFYQAYHKHGANWSKVGGGQAGGAAGNQQSLHVALEPFESNTAAASLDQGHA